MRNGSNGLAAAVVVGLAFAVSTSPAAPLKEKATQPAKPTQITVFWPKPAFDNEFYQALRAVLDVTIDGRKVGDVDVGKPLTVGLPAGPHKLKVGHSGLLSLELTPGDMPVNLPSGKTSYFYVYSSPQGLRVHEVDEATAQAEISGTAPKTPGTATVHIYWRSPLLDLNITNFDFFLDGKKIGTMTSGEYIVAKVPSGKHLLTQDSLGIKEVLILGTGLTHYYLMHRKQYWEFYELSPDQLGAVNAMKRRQ